MDKYLCEPPIHDDMVISGLLIKVITPVLSCLCLPEAECRYDALLKAYPDHLARIERDTLIWKDGTRMRLDHGIRHKNHEDWLNASCLRDQLFQCYIRENLTTPPRKNHDPGRARYEPFFLKMYGSTTKEVESRLTTITWLPGILDSRLRVTTVNGIDKKLIAVSDELSKLPPAMMVYLKNPGGTFNWRTIAGTSRLSTHSFGITIDINVEKSHYWRNAKPDAKGNYKYVNSIPIEIVRIFEKHGFIWGGRWYHYDTMHFEYRPELLEGCACG